MNPVSKAIAAMEGAFRRIESKIAPPEPVQVRASLVVRYKERGIYQAIVQKLARYISTINAIGMLLKAGFVQEVGVLFRTLDEIEEDVFFLATGVNADARTERHDKYLAAFYADPVTSRPEGAIEMPKPDLLPRKKIRAHTFAKLGAGVDIERASAALESVHTTYSGYVHANSESIMDLCGGDPPRFFLNGMAGTPRVASYAKDAMNYIMRGLLATMAACKAFGEPELYHWLEQELAEFESVIAPSGPASEQAERTKDSGAAPGS